MTTAGHCSLLPSYSPSLPSPSYSCEPACDEQRLDHTPRPVRLRSAPTGTFIKKSGKLTLVLYDQEDGVDIPVYGRMGSVVGTLCLDNPDPVVEVVLKIEGRLDSTISEGGSKSAKFLHDSYTLWSDQTLATSCPSHIPFSCVIPSTYTDGDAERRLAPSYSASFINTPSLFVRSLYTITITTTRVRHRKFGFLTKTKSLSTPFNYCPRTRAHRPIISSPCFFSAIKTSPEEWYQTLSVLKTRNSSRMEPIHCHLFIPAGRVYGLTDTIPFHVQLNGPISSLREFLPPPALDRITSSDSHMSTTSQSQKHPPGNSSIRVYLLRQTSVTVSGELGSRSIVLAEGQLRALPPSASYSLPCGSREASLDWEGEIRCEGDIDVGGFTALNVAVKDFIILSLSPPDRHKSDFLETQNAIPIRLVTDSYTEQYGPRLSTF